MEVKEYDMEDGVELVRTEPGTGLILPTGLAAGIYSIQYTVYKKYPLL